MIGRIRSVYKNPLIISSLVMIIGSNLANLLNYIYHLIVGRMLGPASYGDLAALFSMMGLLGMLPFSLALVVTRFISRSKSSEETVGFIEWIEKRVFLIALVLFILILLNLQIISNFLNINNQILVLITGATFLFSLPAASNRAVLQGLFKFKQIIFSTIAESATKLILGVFLIYLGYAVFGAIIGVLISAIVGWLLAKIFIGEKDKGKKVKPDMKEILNYSFPVIVQTLAITSLYTTDLLLVKHFFSAQQAGIYASLSTLGRIIFFGTGPIAAVMFPMTSKKHSTGENHQKVFLLSLGLTLNICLGVLVIYGLFPVISVNTLFGSLFQEGASLLLWFGVFMTFFSLSSLFINYYLSIGDTRVVILPLLAAIAQGVGIMFYHSNLFEVILVSTISSGMLLSILVLNWFWSFKAE